MAEELIYSDDRISISPSRIVVGTTTYTVRDLKSVAASSTTSSIGCAGLLIIVSLWMLGAGGMKLVQRADAETIALLLLGGAIIGAGGVLWARNCKDKFHVVIESGSGKANALTSKDKTYVEKIVTSVDEAIMRNRRV